jgi:hypothetical protein
VHHGNGTDHGFQGDPDVFYGSTHERDNFPGTGHEPKLKGPHATQEIDRRIVNRYLSPGSISKMQFRTKWAEIISEMELFRPDLIIFSAGFDAHTQDPLGGCSLDEADFVWATQIVLDATYKINPDGAVPCMSVLEGGYNLSAVAKSIVVHCGVLRTHKPTVNVVRPGGSRGGPVTVVTTASSDYEVSASPAPAASEGASPHEERPSAPTVAPTEAVETRGDDIKLNCDSTSGHAEMPLGGLVTDGTSDSAPQLPPPAGDPSVEGSASDDLIDSVERINIE